MTDGLRGSAIPLNDDKNNNSYNNNNNADKNDANQAEGKEDAPPEFDPDDDDASTVIINPANAISFAQDGAPYGESYSLDYKTQLKLKYQLSTKATGRNQHEQSYPTAMVEGTITAMKLQTYLNFSGE